MKNALTLALDTFAAMREAFTADMQAVRKGRKTKRTFESITSSTKLTAPILRVLEADLLAGYVALAAHVRPMTEEEAAKVAESTEAQGQGLLPNGEPMQAELFVQSPIRITEDDFDGKQLTAEVIRYSRMIRAAVQFDGTTQFLRYSANATARCLRNDDEPRRASFGGRMYSSDRMGHDGILFAIVTKNEKGGTLANIEWVGRDFEAEYKANEKEAVKALSLA